MTVLIGAVVIFVLWLLAVFGVLVGLILLVARIGGPKRTKRQPPRSHRSPRSPRSRRPGLRPPHYIPRWGLYRKHSVAAEKAQWEKDFSRLASPSATAVERDREFTPPSAPPPAPTPDEVFTGLRKRLSNLA